MPKEISLAVAGTDDSFLRFTLKDPTSETVIAAYTNANASEVTEIGEFDIHELSSTFQRLVSRQELRRVPAPASSAAAADAM